MRQTWQDLLFAHWTADVAEVRALVPPQISRSAADRLAGTMVIYAQPLSHQLGQAEVPESLYSTSEDGYLLQAWIGREQRLDDESRLASSADLAAYLHAKYGDVQEKSTDPMRYLHELYEHESQADTGHKPTDAERNPAGQPAQ